MKIKVHYGGDFIYIKNEKKTNILKLMIIYIYAFYVIYVPSIEYLFDINITINKYNIMMILLFITGIPYLLSIRGKKIKDKSVMILFLGILISSIYFCIRVLIKFEYISFIDLRIIQNNFILLQILHIIIIINLLKKIGVIGDKKIKFFFNLGVLQALFCIIMIIVPSTKNIALLLYYGDASENIFISTSRIYGITSDYTFGTPIYHSFLASVALILAYIKDKKYLIYIPFLMLTILLNNRTGIIIFIINAIIIYIFFLSEKKMMLKSIKILLLILLFVFLGLQFISTLNPNTYNFISVGIEDTLTLFSDGELNGNYEALFDTMLYWPKGSSIIFGEGYRVYAENGYENGQIPSDIGYVNDMFMGGLIYVSILYITIIIFLNKKFYKGKEVFEFDEKIMKIIFFISIVTLAISNFKGESMKGGIVLLGVIMIKLIFKSMYEENIK